MKKLTLSFNEVDRRKLDELKDLLKALHGFAPESYARLVRVALDAFLETKQEQWDKAQKEPRQTGRRSKGNGG